MLLLLLLLRRAMMSCMRGVRRRWGHWSSHVDHGRRRQVAGMRQWRGETVLVVPLVVLTSALRDSRLEMWGAM